MWSLFNVVRLFGNEYDWDIITTLTTMMIIEIALTFVALVILMIVVLLRTRKAPVAAAEEPKEVLPEAKPDVKPTVIKLKENAAVVLTAPEQEQDSQGEKGEEEKVYEWYLNGELVEEKGNVYSVSDGFAAGNYSVQAMFDEELILNFVLIVEAEEKEEEIAVAVAEPEPEVIPDPVVPVVISEESAEAGKLRYDRSFTARLIQSEDSVKQWYTLLKNELLSYKKVKPRMSWKRESFRASGSVFADGESRTIARLSHRGKTLCLFLPLNPANYEDTKYKVELEDSTSYEDTPCLYRIKNEKRLRYALELIQTAMEQLNVPRVEHETEDFYMPYEGVVELIEKGLVKRVIKSKEEEAIFEEIKHKN